MKRFVVCLVFLVLSISTTSLGADLTTKAGKTYYNIQLISNRCDAVSITFLHKVGTAKLAYSELSETDKIRFGYDPEAENRRYEARKKAADERKKEIADAKAKTEAYAEAERQAAKEKQLAECERENQVKVEKTLSNARAIFGVPIDFSPVIEAREKLTKMFTAYSDSAKEDPSIFRKMTPDQALEKYFIECQWNTFGKYVVVGKVRQVCEQGLLVDCSDSVLSGTDKLIFLANHREQETVVDGDKVSALALPFGRYRFIDTAGAVRTVPFYYAAQKPATNVTIESIRPLPELPLTFAPITNNLPAIVEEKEKPRKVAL